jgi:DNA-3-methyladenine glycosylase I
VPRSDDEHFEALTAAVFSARFNPDIVRRRWPAIRKAFGNFHIDLVASWPDREADRLLSSPGMIRSRKKVLATLRNVRELVNKTKAYGSVRCYMDAFGSDPDALIRELDGWAHYVGAPSLRCFLSCLGRYRDEPV